MSKMSDFKMVSRDELDNMSFNKWWDYIQQTESNDPKFLARAAWEHQQNIIESLKVVNISLLKTLAND